MMNEDYKINIFKLAADGLNWVMYQNCMKYALDMHRWARHLVSTVITQEYKDASNIGGMKPEVCWKTNEAVVRQLIIVSMPDSVFNHIKGSANVKSIWDELKKIFEGCMRNLLINLGRKLQNMKCGEDDDIHAHFKSLANFHKQLVAMGQIISDDQYMNMLMSSLPSSYYYQCQHELYLHYSCNHHLHHHG